jgi:hypothetical protein
MLTDNGGRGLLSADPWAAPSSDDGEIGSREKIDGDYC